MKAKDMREKSAEDLAELHKSLVREAFQSRFKNFNARLDDTSSLKKARRDVARLKTILNERKNIGGATPSTSRLEAVAHGKTVPTKAAPAQTAKAPKAAKAAKTSSKTAKAGASEATK